MNIIIIFRKNITRNFSTNENILAKKDIITYDILDKLLNNYIQTTCLYDSINKNLLKRKIRKPNFPSEISENIVKFAIFKKYKIMPSWEIKNGDLQILNKKLEVKGFISTGPSSFGPTKKWNILYFVDCTEYKEKIFKIYEINLSNNNEYWKNININKNETYNDQCLRKIRPRISFNLLHKQIKDYCKLIFNGNIKDLCK